MNLLNKYVLLGFITFLMIGACQNKSKNNSDKIILRVGEIKFTEDEYKIYIEKEKRQIKKNTKNTNLVNRLNNFFFS